MNKKKFKMCVITAPLPKISGIHILVENFLRLLEPMSEDLNLISANYPSDAIFSSKIHLTNICYDNKQEAVFLRMIKQIIIQFLMSYYIFRDARKCEVILIFIGTALILPVLTARLLRKKIVLIATGSGAKGARYAYSNSLFGSGSFIFYHIFQIIEEINRSLVDRIVVLSQGLVFDLGLSKYSSKLSFNCATFIDTDLFQINNRCRRDNLIGYIGRLTEAKGVMNFVKAIELSSANNDTEFLIGGDGHLYAKIKQELETNNLDDKVTLTGWIAHEDLPDYMNKLKLLVVPSYTEVFAATALEAMACGVLVLVTPVGATLDIIKDGENGFIMENNSPECIAWNIERALNYSDSKLVQENGRKLVEDNFSYRIVVKKYSEIIDGLFK